MSWKVWDKKNWLKDRTEIGYKGLFFFAVIFIIYCLATTILNYFILDFFFYNLWLPIRTLNEFTILIYLYCMSFVGYLKVFSVDIYYHKLFLSHMKKLQLDKKSKEPILTLTDDLFKIDSKEKLAFELTYGQKIYGLNYLYDSMKDSLVILTSILIFLHTVKSIFQLFQ